MVGFRFKPHRSGGPSSGSPGIDRSLPAAGNESSGYEKTREGQRYYEIDATGNSLLDRLPRHRSHDY
jgi:hypothetical protein